MPFLCFVRYIYPRNSSRQYKWDDWGQAELTAFEQLKEALISAPVLAVLNRDQPFQVHTDASVVGTGGVLVQGSCVVRGVYK